MRQTKKQIIMKKTIFYAFSLLLCALVFVSCSKEAKLEKSIVGTWKEIRYYDSEDGGWENISEEGVTWNFKSNNKGIRSVTYEDEKYSYSFNYTISDDLLTIIYIYEDGERDTETVTIESIKSKTMVWRFEGNDKMELKKQ